MAEHVAPRPLVMGFCPEDSGKDRPDATETKGAAAGENTGKVPVTVLTGFLGSGKTTLLNRILTTHHGKRIAVVQNEFGEDLGLGSTLAAEGGGGEVFEESFEMNNGCICCSVRDDLVNTLERIMQNRSKFDYILVETTGMANPGPIASIFWLDEELGSDIFLDAIITLVDAKHVLQHLDDPTGQGGAHEAQQQIAFADRVLLNKVDLVDEAQLAAVEARVRGVNALAPIIRTQRSEVDLDAILDIHAFDESRASDLDRALNAVAPAAPPADAAAHGHDHGDGHGHAHSSDSAAAAPGHSAAIGTVAVTETRALDLQKVNLWLGEMLWEGGVGAEDIFRIKGVLHIKDDKRRHVLQVLLQMPLPMYRCHGPRSGPADARVCQAVHTLFDITPAADWSCSAGSAAVQSKVVLIGRNLDLPALKRGQRTPPMPPGRWL